MVYYVMFYSILLYSILFGHIISFFLFVNEWLMESKCDHLAVSPLNLRFFGSRNSMPSKSDSSMVSRPSSTY